MSWSTRPPGPASPTDHHRRRSARIVTVIGCGQISDLHAAAYSGSDAARIVALVDPDRQGAEAKRGQWGLPEATVYTDYRDALDLGDVDIAEILVPHDLHHEIAAAALAAGKHVSLQKAHDDIARPG